jgi:hypothetical protein
MTATGRHRNLAFAAGATIAAGALYFTGLGRQSLWLDELYSATSSTGSLADLYAFWLWDRHPPTYGLLLRGWSAVFGRGEVELRALSALAATLSVALLFLLGRRVVPERVALTAALLMAGSTTALYYAQEVRVYSVLMLATTLATLAWLAALREVRAGRSSSAASVAFALAGLFAASLHYYGAALVAFQVAYLAVVAVRHGGLRAFPLVPGLVALGPIAFEMAMHLPHLTGDFADNAISPPSLNLAKGIVAFHLGTNRLALALLVGVPVLSIALAGPRRARQQLRDILQETEGRRQLVDIGTMVVVPLALLAASSFVLPTLISRNTIVFLPATLLLTAWWLSLAPSLAGARLPLFAAALGVITMATFLPGYAAPHKQEWRAVAHEVLDRAADDSLLVMLERPTQQPLVATGGHRRRLWDYYLRPDGVAPGSVAFDDMVAVANTPEALDEIVDRARGLGRSRLLVIYAHVPPMTEETEARLRSVAVAFEHAAYARAGLYEVVLWSPPEADD